MKLWTQNWWICFKLFTRIISFFWLLKTIWNSLLISIDSCDVTWMVNDEKFSQKLGKEKQNLERKKSKVISYFSSCGLLFYFDFCWEKFHKVVNYSNKLTLKRKKDFIIRCCHCDTVTSSFIIICLNLSPELTPKKTCKKLCSSFLK